MIAIIGGLGAAACWAASTLCSSRSSRMIDPASVLAWVMLFGLIVTLPALLISDRPDDLGAGDLTWLVLVGVSNAGGLLLAYRALRIGKVGLVAPVVSTEGAIAALIAIIAGEGIAAGTGLLLLLISAGVFVAATSPDAEAGAGGQTEARAIGYAIAAACSFGLTLYATGRAGADLPVAWVLLPARLVGVLVFALPLALTGSLQLTRPALPLVVVTGISEVVGVAAFALGARHGIAVTSVLASQFATISVVAAYLLFGERLSPAQTLGVAATVIGVGALSAVQAA
jgi:drug/metabolite transporter (DMT)-like permease